MINCLEVDIDAIKHNIAALRSLSQGALFNAVVKANGYGLGASEIACRIEHLVDYFSVATVSEGADLRESGIQKPILVLGYVDEEEYESILAYDLDMVLYDEEIAEKLADFVIARGDTVRVQIKIDTGHSRLGFRADDASLNKVGKIYGQKQFNVIGIFSHFSTSDERDFSFTDLQYDRFRSFVKKLEATGIDVGIRHISNDAGVVAHGYSLDMVRSGIGMYGIYPSEFVKQLKRVELKPAFRLLSKVSFVKDIFSKDSVSYGRTFIAEKRTRVATVSIGYGDGIRRLLSNRWHVLIHGRQYRIIGNICMDQLMVDLEDNEEIRIGDTVTLIGRDGDSEIMVEEMAKTLETIPYEIMTSIDFRVPRKYIELGKTERVVNYILQKDYRFRKGTWRGIEDESEKR